MLQQLGKVGGVWKYMKKELDDALVRDFPSVFSDRHADRRSTAMCWGFECGDGWEKIIRELAEKLTWLGVAKAVQVKEKFGTLCFYIHSSDEPNDFSKAEGKIRGELSHNAISSAACQSAHTCEECGEFGRLLYSNGSPYGWMKTLCKKCADPLDYKEVTDED
jgi:hypothetical protein